MKKRDCLLREDNEVSDICALIDYHSNKKSNISFAIDGEWGCGKSFVLEMVEEKLKEEKINNGLEYRYVVFHYNCWEYDYYDEPLVAIVSMMIKQIKEELKALNNKFNEEALHKDKKYRKILTVFTALKGAGSIVLAGLDGIIEKQAGISIKNILEEFHVTEEEIKEINNNKEIVDNISDFDPLTSFNNALNLLREALNIMAEEKTIVFVVDELDRCLPEYAIKVLERLHHISEEVDNLITVIAVDKSRLLDSISNAFGYDKSEVLKDSEKYRNSERYMKKFVDFYYPLDKGYFLSLDDSIKYKTYLDLFDFGEKKYDIKWFFSNFVRNLFAKIDMREQEHLIEKAEMIHTIINYENQNYDLSVIYIELLLTVVYSCYEIKKESLYSFLTDLRMDDNFKSFRNYFSERLYFDEDKKTKLKVINDNNDKIQLLAWYAAFLKETIDFVGTLPDNLESADGISRDTSIIKEKYGIDMEENLEFLYKFYKKLESLS